MTVRRWFHISSRGDGYALKKGFSGDTVFETFSLFFQRPKNPYNPHYCIIDCIIRYISNLYIIIYINKYINYYGDTTYLSLEKAKARSCFLLLAQKESFASEFRCF
jgi:hypothetical protein